MKTKAKLILNSLADLPVNTFAFAASVPGRAVEMTKQVLTPPVRATRREIREARRRSANVMTELYARSKSPLLNVQPWPRGGLNE